MHSGQSIHAGVAEWHHHSHGANAVMALADLLLKLESLNIPVIAPPGFEHLGFTITPGTIFHGRQFPEHRPGFRHRPRGYSPVARTILRRGS